MKKQAILIIAHNNIEVLNRLLELLDSKYFDIYLHIDLKSSIKKEDLYECKISTLNVYKVVNILWGDYSMIEAEMFLFGEASKNMYEYYHLISGVDLPIKSNKYIYEFFHNNYPKEFDHFKKNETSESRVDRVKYYHFMSYNKNHDDFLNQDYAFVRKQKMDGVDRLANDNNIVKSGCNWISVTHEFLEYLLLQAFYIEKTYPYTRCADEVFVQTLLFNSEFRNNLYDKNYDANFDACLRAIDWNRGDPYVWRDEDFEELKTSKCVFARKFDYETDSQIVEDIYNYVRDLNQED